MMPLIIFRKIAPGLPTSPSNSNPPGTKKPTDVWWHTIVAGKEKVGYPSQKPQGMLKRLVLAHSSPGDAVLDAFAGSGAFGRLANGLGRNADFVEVSPKACSLIRGYLFRNFWNEAANENYQP